MEWPRVKSLLLAVLLCVNLFMMGMLAASYRGEHCLRDDMLDAVPGLMAQKGVEISRGVLSRQKVRFADYTIPTRTDPLLAFAAKAVFGLQAAPTEQLGEYATVSDFATLTLRFPEDAPRFSDTAALAEYLERAAGLAPGSLHLERNTREGDAHRVFFAQYIGDAAVQDYGIELVTENGRLRTASGRLLVQEELVRAQSFESDAVTALFLFRDYEGRPETVEVQSIQAVYQVADDAWGAARTVPGYRIYTADGSSYFVAVKDKKVSMIAG